jgi:hypothetical protein
MPKISSVQNAFAVDRPMHWNGDAGTAGHCAGRLIRRCYPQLDFRFLAPWTCALNASVTQAERTSAAVIQIEWHRGDAVRAIRLAG